MTDKQIKWITEDLLSSTLGHATDSGVLDDLSADIGPDVVNKFCDALEQRVTSRSVTVNRQTVTGVKYQVAFDANGLTV